MERVTVEHHGGGVGVGDGDVWLRYGFEHAFTGMAFVSGDGRFLRVNQTLCRLLGRDSEQDVLKSYDLGANCYITKPVDFAKFIQVVQTIEGFWFSVVRLPPPP